MSHSPLTIYSYVPHNAQAIIHNSPAQYRVVVAGRRFGKTALAFAEIGKYCQHHPDSTALWVSWSQWQAKVAFVLARPFLFPSLESIDESGLCLHFTNGSCIHFTAENDSERVYDLAVSFAILMEPVLMNGFLWYKNLWPVVCATEGRTLFVGTPRIDMPPEDNWFYTLYQHAEHEKGWESFSFPSSTNPYIPQGVFEDARSTLPEHIYQQDFLAQFFSKVPESVDNA